MANYSFLETASSELKNLLLPLYQASNIEWTNEQEEMVLSIVDNIYEAAREDAIETAVTLATKAAYLEGVDRENFKYNFSKVGKFELPVK